MFNQALALLPVGIIPITHRRRKAGVEMTSLHV